MSKLKSDIIQWVKNYLNSFGGNTKAIIGISGGKDSSIAAAICVAAVGAERVIGVLMPDGNQHDISEAYKLVNHLGIKYYEMNIHEVTEAFRKITKESFNTNELPDVVTTNMPARVRMTNLYNVAGMYGDARVVNTCNLSEDWIGYSTKFGDSAGDFSILSKLTVTEILPLGIELGIPKELVYKIPEDGMSGKSDEEKIGFTYEILDNYIRTGICKDDVIKNKIDKMHKMNLHKVSPMPTFEIKDGNEN